MSVDRAELAGTGAAVVFHVALIAALSMSLAHVAVAPEPPAMEVELVDEVGLAPAAPSTIPTPPPASVAPDVAAADQPLPAPALVPLPPAPRIVPTPALRATERATARPAAPAPARPAARASRIGNDFLKGIADSPSRSVAPAKPSAATVSASAMAGIVQAIRRQVQPCADRQVNPGPGASRIRVKMRLMLFPNGRLKGAPQVLSTSGVDDENGRFEERVKDLAVATFVGCAPLTGLPPELYETDSGRGWSDFIMNYNLP
ncbi:MAG: cell envelope biogenesis protein TolA [Sphingomicrobium sp.]